MTEQAARTFVIDVQNPDSERARELVRCLEAFSASKRPKPTLESLLEDVESVFFFDKNAASIVTRLVKTLYGQQGTSSEPELPPESKEAEALPPESKEVEAPQDVGNLPERGQGNIPYGYLPHPDGVHLMPHPEEQGVLREVKRLRKEDNSWRAIAGMFNIRGIKNRQGRKWNHTNLIQCYKEPEDEVA